MKTGKMKKASVEEASIFDEEPSNAEIEYPDRMKEPKYPGNHGSQRGRPKNFNRTTQAGKGKNSLEKVIWWPGLNARQTEAMMESAVMGTVEVL